MMNLIYLLYSLEGIATAVIFLYLGLYYISHAKRIGSSYFKSLGNLFLGWTVLAFLWGIYGLFALNGMTGFIKEIRPVVTLLSITIVFLLSFKYLRRTNAY